VPDRGQIVGSLFAVSLASIVRSFAQQPGSRETDEVVAGQRGTDLLHSAALA
jgi:hypothetical protein